MKADLCYTEASELSNLIRAKKISPVEVVQAHLDRIERVNPKLNAIVTRVDADAVLARAREAEAALQRGEIWGPLHGVPFTMKDVFDTQGVRTTRGSRLFADRVPTTDATLVRRLKEAGGILLGKTNIPEFALAAETSNVLFGRTENPWKIGRTPGGSSGGEGAAIAAGLSPFGVGSDLGGSNRLPAHYCGIVGLKATHGRVPLTGHWPELLADSMHAGPLARSVRDAALVLSILNGPDEMDPYAVPASLPDFSRLGDTLPRLRVAHLTEGPFAPVAKEIQDVVTKAAAALEDLGCEVESVSLDSWKKATPIDVALVFLSADGVHYLEPYIGQRRDDLSPSSAGLLELPRPTLNQYLDARKRMQEFSKDLASLFERFDLLVCPTAPLVAHAHDAQELSIDGQTAPPHHAASATVAFGLSGSPAISVPFGWSQAEDLPIGVQLVAHRFHEEKLLLAAAALESSYNPPRQRPAF